MVKSAVEHNPLPALQVKYCLAVLLWILVYVLQAQSTLEPSLSLAELSRSERFRSNARLVVNGKTVGAAAWSSLNLAGESDVRVSFRKDSVKLISTNPAGSKLEVTFPNDITLLTNADRKDLQERLLDLIRSQGSRTKFDDNGKKPGWVNTVRGATRFGLLSDIGFRDSTDSKPVCHPSMPLYSLVNAFRDTTTCSGLFPVRLVLHRYGNVRDTVDTSVAGILRATGAAPWMKWSGVEADELTLLLQHPFISYEHLLFLRKDPSHGGRWLADLHAFIPTHNLVGLFTAYSPAKRKELFKVIR